MVLETDGEGVFAVMLHDSPQEPENVELRLLCWCQIAWKKLEVEKLSTE